MIILMWLRIYNGKATSVRAPSGNTSKLPITRGWHQGSALNLDLFMLVMDVLTMHILDNISWCMLFADDMILVDESE